MSPGPLPYQIPLNCINMAFYQTNLGVLVVLNALLFYRQRRSNRERQNPTWDLEAEEEEDAAEKPKDFVAEADTRVSDFVKQYLTGHLLAFAADWLQVRRFHLGTHSSQIPNMAFSLLFLGLTMVVKS